MRGFSVTCSAIAFALVSAFPGVAVAAKDSIVLVYSGDAIPNTHAAPTTPEFAAWCQGTCTPSVSLPVFDGATGKKEGKIHVWTTPFISDQAGLSFCFSEFIWFNLGDGDIYTASKTGGVCGGTFDPSLKPATHAPQPAIVVGGGGDGLIVGGTKKYKNWDGTYTDRVFVELTFVPGGTNYYDSLIFIISKN